MNIRPLRYLLCLAALSPLPAPSATMSWRGNLDYEYEDPTPPFPSGRCLSTIDHQSFRLDAPSTITITGSGLNVEGVQLFLSTAVITDSTWHYPSPNLIAPWRIPRQDYTVSFLLDAGNYILSVNDIDGQWYPFYGLQYQAYADACVNTPYDMAITGDFIPTGRWEGNISAFPSPFTYTPQVPEPRTLALTALVAGLAICPRRRRSQ